MNVIIMVSDGYPKKFSANNSKGEFIAKGIKEAGGKVLMVDNISGTKGQNIFETGVSESGINYCLFPRRGKYFSFFYNIPLFCHVLKKTKTDKNNHLILSMDLLPFFLLIIFLSKLYGYKCGTLFHEWHISCYSPNRLKRWEAYLKDNYFGYFLDYIFPISHYLNEKSTKFKKKSILLPVLASYEREPYTCETEKHFTFCGHASYLIRNTLILEAFKQVKVKHDSIFLYLILVGNDEHLKKINTLINKLNLNESVKILTQIPQQELLRIYDTSLGLLIPLDPNNLQDVARFSQKIAEYLTSRRPIITSNVGEIAHYFNKDVNAIIEPYTIDGYTNGMNKLISDSQLADNIGLNGFHLGKKFFNYKVAGKQIYDFLHGFNQ